MTTIVINYHVNVNKVSEIRVVFTSNVIYRVYVFRNGSPPLFPGASVISLVPGSSRPTPERHKRGNTFTHAPKQTWRRQIPGKVQNLIVISPKFELVLIFQEATIYCD